MSNENQLTPLSWVIYATCAVIWGFSFQMMKWGLESFTSYQLACVRLLSAGVVFLPFLGRELRHISKQDFYWIALSTTMSSFLPAFLFCMAETQVDGTTAGILNSTTPIWAFLIGITLFRHPITFRQLVGVGLGFLSVVMIMLSEHELKHAPLGYSMLIILATLGYAGNVWIVSKKLARVKAFTLSTVGLCFNLVPSLIILLTTDLMAAYRHDSFMDSLSAGLFLGIFGTATIGYIFFLLIKRTSAVFASTVTYAIPVVGILVGTIVGEHITIWQLAGIGGILLGIYLSKPIHRHK